MLPDRLTPDRPRQVRPVAGSVRPELAPFFVRMLTAGERARLDQAETSDRRNGWHKARLVQMTLCGSDGRALLRESDIPRVAELPHDAVDLIYLAALDLNGLSVQSTEDAEARVKSCPTTQFLYVLADRYGIPKPELADRLTSYDITEYMAREKVCGPDSLWESALLRHAVLNSFSEGPKFEDMIPEAMRWRIPEPTVSQVQSGMADMWSIFR